MSVFFKTLKKIPNSGYFWLAVSSLIPIGIFLNRVLIPDYSTDVLSYHLFNGLRAFYHPFVPFSPIEYYPVGIANIAPYWDALTYLARSLVGYRLGTGLTVIAAIGCLVIVYQILTMILAENGKKFNAFWGLILLSSGIVLELEFQIATYDVDIINSLAVLLVFYAVLVKVLRSKSSTINLIFWSLCWLALGCLLAFKLTNLPFVLAIGGLLIWNLIHQHKKIGRRSIVKLVLASLLIIIPLLPSWLSNYHLTHNPLYPYYNGIFHSPEYAPVSYQDNTFGGTAFASKLFWPVASLGDQLRLGEPHHIYNDYKLALYWALAILTCLLAILRWIRIGFVSKVVLVYFVVSTFLWGLLFGIERYFISSMLLGGLILAILISAKINDPKRQLRYFLLAGLASLGLVVAVIEDYRIIHFNLRYDISWRTPLHADPSLHRSQLDYLFSDHLNISPAEQKTVTKADILLNCNTNVAGLMVLLPNSKNKPVVNIISDGLPQYADMSNNVFYKKYRNGRLSSSTQSKRTYKWVSIISNKDIGPTAKGCYTNIRKNGGVILSHQPVDSLLGYSNIKLSLIEGTIEL